MKLTQITVSYGETQSLPEYSNVKPNLTLSAVLDEGDDPQAAERYLWEQAKTSVHEQIDLALEANGKAAKYSTEPRYQVMQTYRNHWRSKDDPPALPPLVVILPNEAKLDDKRFVHASHSADSRKQRLHVARRIAAQVAGEFGAELIDCSDGDLSSLELAIASIDEAAAMQREFDAAMDAIEHEHEAVAESERASDDGEDNSL